MTKADIVNKVSSSTGLTKIEIEYVLEGILATISNSLKNGDRVDIRGFGSFSIKHRLARDARNPATREIVKLKDRYIPFFKVSNLLKEEVNKSLSSIK
tara:strand:- start:192 stop:485 length:294 start_codon:yes stop_codon:yes gene_type:complete